MRRRSGSVIFPLKMKNNQEVTTLEELQQNFDVKKGVEYFLNGKLQKWLENIYEDDIVEELEMLTGEERDFLEQFTKILGVEHGKNEIDIHEIQVEANLKEQLKEFFSADKIEVVVKKTATNQMTFKQLVEKGTKKIYLLSGSFCIEKDMEELELIGIGEPLIETEEIDAEQFYMKHIQVEGHYEKGVNLERILKENTNETIFLEFLDMLKLYLTEMTKEERLC